MARRQLQSLRVAQLVSMVLLFMLSGCGDESTSPQSSGVDSASAAARASSSAPLPLKGKVAGTTAPANAAFGMIFVDTSRGREYIYDGAQWVPHDATVDAFYAEKTKYKPKALMQQDEVSYDGDPDALPTGAHGAPGLTPAGHSSFDCSVCHKVGGRLVFDKNGPAYGANLPKPYFNATDKTCLNVACHNASGTYSYYQYNWGSDSYDLVTITYGGGTSRPTPSWYTTGAGGCSACHDDPPRTTGAWHSGYHGGQGPTGARNQCQFCHPDATSPGNGIGDTITNASLHADGTVEVQATFTSACFGCH